MRPTEESSLKVFVPNDTWGATSVCMGKSRLQTERYYRKNSGAAKTLNSLPIEVTFPQRVILSEGATE